MLFVTGVHLRDITNTLFFFDFVHECESSGHLLLLHTMLVCMQVHKGHQIQVTWFEYTASFTKTVQHITIVCRLSYAGDLVRLYCIIHQDSSAHFTIVSRLSDAGDLVRLYCIVDQDSSTHFTIV